MASPEAKKARHQEQAHPMPPSWLAALPATFAQPDCAQAPPPCPRQPPAKYRTHAKVNGAVAPRERRGHLHAQSPPLGVCGGAP
eukprot:CAMPEP_0206034104 /NCGR_PEP_ID=MMETSP1466-20131121/1119_1 /ASSEMBLY_ACC=CAM_ASM_001126 /TAXON_ID=44452 /ORGANISM="Pavlova gyrans, Strain CCMP608" /LENGTH=83 /DNA_ID=CAMNT_0053408363 /DNA_START=33 /DNA_END=281 /DNA_ORIENTATION=+